MDLKQKILRFYLKPFFYKCSGTDFKDDFFIYINKTIVFVEVLFYRVNGVF